jgi:transposase
MDISSATTFAQNLGNYFIDRVTQGFVEGINNAVRFVIRRAFGFRNFDNFRLHILAQYGGG